MPTIDKSEIAVGLKTKQQLWPLAEILTWCSINTPFPFFAAWEAPWVVPATCSDQSKEEFWASQPAAPHKIATTRFVVWWVWHHRPHSAAWLCPMSSTEWRPWWSHLKFWHSLQKLWFQWCLAKMGLLSARKKINFSFEIALTSIIISHVGVYLGSLFWLCDFDSRHKKKKHAYHLWWTKGIKHKKKKKGQQSKKKWKRKIVLTDILITDISFCVIAGLLNPFGDTKELISMKHDTYFLQKQIDEIDGKLSLR